jgi:hypothetical protein
MVSSTKVFVVLLRRSIVHDHGTIIRIESALSVEQLAKHEANPMVIAVRLRIAESQERVHEPSRCQVSAKWQQSGTISSHSEILDWSDNYYAPPNGDEQYSS